MALISIRCFGRNVSARLNVAETSAPTTKPTWTAIVNHALAEAERSHCRLSCGSTAAAENQGAIDRTMATASTDSARQRPGGSGSPRAGLGHQSR